MKTLKWTLCGLAIVSLFSAAAVAADTPKTDANKPAPAAAGAAVDTSKLGDYQPMADFVKVNQKEADQILKIKTDKDTALANWDKENEPKITKLDNDISKADKTTKAHLEKNLKDLKEKRTQLGEQFDAKAFQAITSQQRSDWFADQINKLMTTEFQPASLTADQTTKVKDISTAAAKNMPSLALDAKADDPALKPIKAQIIGLLTKEQKANYEKSKKGNKK